MAATCYRTLGEYLTVDGSETNMFTSILAFFLLWVIVPIALGMAANLLTAAIKGMCLGLPNSLLGAFGLFVHQSETGDIKPMDVQQLSLYTHLTLPTNYSV